MIELELMAIVILAFKRYNSKLKGLCKGHEYANRGRIDPPKAGEGMYSCIEGEMLNLNQN